MKRARSLRRGMVLLPVAVILFGSCFAEPNPVQDSGTGATATTGGSGASGGKGGKSGGGSGGTGDAGSGGTDGPGFMPGTAGMLGTAGDDSVVPAGSCKPLRELDEHAACRTVDSAEPLHGRIPDATATDQTIPVSSLFELFNRTCGNCHVAASLGDPPFQVTANSISAVIDDEVLAIIKSSDEAIFMPPPAAGGKPFDARPDGDPVKKLATWIEVWIAQNRPKDFFSLPANLGGQSPYVYDESFAAALTNIGSCLPDAGLVGTATDRACDLDATFAKAEQHVGDGMSDPEKIGLPPSLDQTDLFTLDAEELAKQGVIGYAPTYPLWSDGAGKMRFIRVPRGKSIHFDAATQEFEIPANTRFYKTFFKQIIDKDGVSRMKKLETRVIVARPNIEHEDGSFEPAALFGTYIWNDQETRAELLTDWQRNDHPFVDRQLEYITDEVKAKEVLDNLPANRDRTLALTSAHLLRHYEIPGRQRCVQCHLGSHNQSFVLGFTPLQVHRRPVGEGGVLEPAGPDELTQLQRLIDYGVITGIESANDLDLLEDSEGERKPRNDYELLAQGYVFGNCSHCHNKNGFASISAPEIRDLLNFFPDREGGIFQFPLDRMSPRIKRGPRLDVSLPYITPSLYDLLPSEGTASTNWTPKMADDPAGGGEAVFIHAPWRSVIYRNVDTPFIYSDDWAIYPHMPRNTAGYDCRAPRILADWMLSIPSTRNTQSLKEACTLAKASECDNASQPYREVMPGESLYNAAKLGTESRLKAYHDGLRYPYCVDQSDVVDPEVVEGRRLTPEDTEIPKLVGVEGGALPEGVPDRVHWVAADETEPLVWGPRRPEWADVIVRGNIPEVDPKGLAETEYWLRENRRLAALEVVELLQSVELDDVRPLALKPFPLGVWKEKAACDLSSVPTVAQLTAPLPRWTSKVAAPESSHVYSVLPGEAVFGMICIHCHGPKADSKGIIAGTLNDMTGGSGRVANFMDGLFGHAADGTLNRAREFGNVVLEGNPAATSDEVASGAMNLAARYLPWMALGGTQIQIPPALLTLIKAAEVLGLQRSGGAGSTGLSANMLSVAQELCFGLLGVRPNGGAPKDFRIDRDLDAGVNGLGWDGIYASSGLILDNGDAELWEAICNWDNPSPVRLISGLNWQEENVKLNIAGLVDRATYAATGAPVGNQDAVIDSSLTSSNRFPWCILEPAAGTEDHAVAVAYVHEHALDGIDLPFCPAQFADSSGWYKQNTTPDSPLYRDDMRRWSTRGAINAGQSVFLFLNEFLVNGHSPQPRYDRCEDLAP